MLPGFTSLLFQNLLSPNGLHSSSMSIRDEIGNAKWAKQPIPSLASLKTAVCLQNEILSTKSLLKNAFRIEKLPYLSQDVQESKMPSSNTAGVCLQNPNFMVSNFQAFQDKTSGGLNEGSCPLIRPYAGYVVGDRLILSNKSHGQGLCELEKLIFVHGSTNLHDQLNPNASDVPKSQIQKLDPIQHSGPGMGNASNPIKNDANQVDSNDSNADMKPESDVYREYEGVNENPSDAADEIDSHAEKPQKSQKSSGDYSTHSDLDLDAEKYDHNPSHDANVEKRGFMDDVYDCSGHIVPYILKGKSIRSRIWAYEKAVSPKLEEVTSHDKVDIILSQFKESDRPPEPHSVYSCNEAIEGAGKPSNPSTPFDTKKPP